MRTENARWFWRMSDRDRNEKQRRHDIERFLVYLKRAMGAVGMARLEFQTEFLFGKGSWPRRARDTVDFYFGAIDVLAKPLFKDKCRAILEMLGEFEFLV